MADDLSSRIQALRDQIRRDIAAPGRVVVPSPVVSNPRDEDGNPLPEVSVDISNPDYVPLLAEHRKAAAIKGAALGCRAVAAVIEEKIAAGERPTAGDVIAVLREFADALDGRH
ncbi:MAG TPA: hypothetical protein VGH89_03305 [Pseudonocardia sp.]|jgi:hypothetical protein